MDYTFNDILLKIGQTIDVAYLIDKNTNSYKTLKDTEIFHSFYGDSGSYSDLMQSLHESSLDKKVAKDTPYGIFSENIDSFIPRIFRHSRIQLGDSIIYASVISYIIDDTHLALLFTQLSEAEYNDELYYSPNMNVLKSAYLFMMNVDLLQDKCETISMSEIDSTPASEPELKYSNWRSMIINMFLPEDKDLFSKISSPEYLKKHLSYQRSNSVECQMMNLDGIFIWVRLIFHRINTGNDDDFQFLFMVEDIHDSHMELMENMKKFESMATHDSLTGVLNRKGFDLELTSHRKLVSGQKPISLMMFDIDHFKSVNDTFGHSMGDAILIKLSEIATERLSVLGGTLGRWGGEEFICFLDDADLARVTDIAEDLRKYIANYDFGEAGHLTISAGVTQVDDADTSKTVFDRIDAALYKAKRSGRNKVVQG